MCQNDSQTVSVLCQCYDSYMHAVYVYTCTQRDVNVCVMSLYLSHASASSTNAGTSSNRCISLCAEAYCCITVRTGYTVSLEL